MDTEGAPSARIYAVTGQSGSGKSSLLGEIARRAMAVGVCCGGFVQPRENIHPPQTREYLLTHLADQTTLLLARRDPTSGFIFEEQAFKQAEQWLQQDAVSAPLLIVDEFGRLEAEGGGHAPALKTVLGRHPQATVLIGVRKSVLGEFRRRFHVARERILDLDTEENNVERFTQALLAALGSPAAPAAAEKLSFRLSRNDGSEKP